MDPAAKLAALRSILLLSVTAFAPLVVLSLLPSLRGARLERRMRALTSRRRRGR